jgi:hypothetical protein
MPKPKPLIRWGDHNRHHATTRGSAVIEDVGHWLVYWVGVYDDGRLLVWSWQPYFHHESKHADGREARVAAERVVAEEHRKLLTAKLAALDAERADVLARLGASP